MFGLVDLPTFLLGAVVVILLPGPNSLFVLSVAARQGVRDGYRAACGVFAGDALLMLLSVAGMAPLLAVYPQVFTVLKLIGAAYLAWMGVGLLRAGWRQWREAPSSRQTVSADDIAQAAAALDSGSGRNDEIRDWVRHPFRRTLGICLLNPKAIFFFMSFFIQFVDRSYPYPALSFALLGLMVSAISCAYLSALIFAGSRLAAGFRRRRKLAAGATGGAGTLFLAFGARLATSATA